MVTKGRGESRMDLEEIWGRFPRTLSTLRGNHGWIFYKGEQQRRYLQDFYEKNEHCIREDYYYENHT